MKILSVLMGLLLGVERVRPDKIRIGVLGTLRMVFQTSKGVENYNALLAELRKDPRVEIVSLDAIGIPDGIIWAGQRSRIEEAIRYFLGYGIDGLLVVACNYGDEMAASQIAGKVYKGLGVPIYTYMCPDEPILSDGGRVLDSECGPYPMRQQMREIMGKNPGYFPFCQIGDEKFLSAYDQFIRICAGVHAIRSVRCLQIGGDQPTFPAIEADTNELRKLFGFEVETVETLSLYLAVTEWLKGERKPEWFATLRCELNSLIDFSATAEQHPDLIDRLTLILGWIAEQLVAKQCNCVTIRCWPELFESLGAMVCPLNGLLYHCGIMAPCETDKPGMMASALLQGLGIGDEKDLNFFADLTRWDGGKPLWWHCGPFDLCGLRCSGGADCKAKARLGWIFENLKHGGLIDGAWGEIGDEVTFAQIRKNASGQLQLTAFNGRICDGTPTTGTHFYTSFQKPEEGFVFTQQNPFDHHNSGRIGNLLPVIREGARWFGVQAFASLDNLSEADAK